MHPLDVVDLVDEQVGELERQLADRSELRIREVTRPGPTEIQVRFGARAHASEVVGQGIILPQGGGFQQPATRVPLLGRAVERDLILRVRCDDWDGLPPEIDLLEATGAELDEWPVDSVGRGIVHNHPAYSRPFFCRPGTREFHTHPVHEDEPWDKHREGQSLSGIVTALLHELTHRWTMRA